MVQWTSVFTIGVTNDSSNSDDINFPPLSGISYHHSPINLCTPGRIRTPVKLTYSFGDCCLSRSATDVYIEVGTGFEPV